MVDSGGLGAKASKSCCLIPLSTITARDTATQKECINCGVLCRMREDLAVTHSMREKEYGQLTH
jgi:hypothetical protein